MNLFEEVGSKTGDDSAGLHERAVAWAYRLTLLDHYLVYCEWEQLSLVERWVLRDAFDRARVAPTFDALRDANWSLRPWGYRQFLTLAYTWGHMPEEDQRQSLLDNKGQFIR